MSLQHLLLLVAVVVLQIQQSGGDETTAAVPLVVGAANHYFVPTKTNQTARFLSGFVCDYKSTQRGGEHGYCNPGLEAAPEYRTHVVGASSSIGKEEVIMRLPRDLQIWDLDALRDKFIQQEFFVIGSDSDGKSSVRHEDTENLLDSGAFLAVHLVRLLQASRRKEKSTLSKGQQCTESGECISTLSWGNVDQHEGRLQHLKDYLFLLPTFGSRMVTKEAAINPQAHPLFWPSSVVKQLFAPHTYTSDLIYHFQRMIESEFEAFRDASADFKANVKYQDYLAARVNVITRAFSSQPTVEGMLWGRSDDMKDLDVSEELAMYETSNPLDHLDSGDTRSTFQLRAMCPLLDMYNSHPNPNARWKFDSETSSYIVTASETIPSKHSIVVSYGKYSEGHLFAKYGYINGDGSSVMEASVAVFHRLLGDVGLGRQFSPLPFDLWDGDSAVVAVDSRAKDSMEIQAKELLRYLTFDDGYEECIVMSAKAASRADEELKLLKFRHLIRLANNRQSWIVQIPAADPNALPNQPAEPSTEKAARKKGKLGIAATGIISMCRLLSLTVEDFEGNAIHHLRNELREPPAPLSIGKQGNALEYRAMSCVVRLGNAALGRYGGYENDESQFEVGTREWAATVIRKGEVRALGMLLQTAARESKRLKKAAKPGTPGMFVREEGSCPIEYSMPLLELIKRD
mmetsp:Transcript_36054/g.85927  ORF Transcript_36054/g.85927 Transcript_36054/m.85927 type:complete len:686 (-) Transcript_36054:33-2090(-)